MKAVSGREMARILEHKGWTLIGIKGSHHKDARGSTRVVIPIHGDRAYNVT